MKNCAYFIEQHVAQIYINLVVSIKTNNTYRLFSIIYILIALFHYIWYIVPW